MRLTNIDGTSNDKFQIGNSQDNVSLENVDGIIKFNNSDNSAMLSDVLNNEVSTVNKTIIGAINELNEITDHRNYSELFNGTTTNGGSCVLSEPYTNYKKIVVVISYYNSVYYSTHYTIDTNLITTMLSEDVCYFAHFFYNDSNLIPITFEFSDVNTFKPHYAWGTIHNMKILGVD